MATKNGWICADPPHGDCGTLHRSYEAAEKDLARENRRVQQGHGANSYSPRRVYRVEDGWLVGSRFPVQVR